MDAGKQYPNPNPNPNPNPSPFPTAPSPRPNNTNPYQIVPYEGAMLRQFFTGSPQHLERAGPSSSGVDRRADWRDGVPLLQSLRVRNMAQLAQVIYANPQVDVPVATALTTAEVAEEKLYNQATDEHDYLMSISDFIQKIPLTCTPEVLRGSRWSPQLVLELPAPLKQHEREKPPLVIPQDPLKLLDALYQRKDEVSDFLNKLVQQFFRQLDLDHEKQQHSSTEQKLMQDTVEVHKKIAGVDFSNGLVEVRIEMDVMATQLRIRKFESRTCDYSQVNDMEECYAKKIQFLIEDFLSKINNKLDELSLDQLQEYQFWLFEKSQKTKKEYLTPDEIDQACFQVDRLIEKAQLRALRCGVLFEKFSSKENSLKNSLLTVASAPVDPMSQIGQLGNSLAVAEYTEKLFSDDITDVADHSDELIRETINAYFELVQQPPLQMQHQPPADLDFNAQINTMHPSQQQLQQWVMHPQQQQLLLQRFPMHPSMQQQSTMGAPQEQHPQQLVMHPQQQQSAMHMHPVQKQHQRQLDVQAPQQPSP